MNIESEFIHDKLKKGSKYHVIRTNAFYENFENFKKSDTGKKLIKRYNKKNHRLKRMVSYRLLNYWEKCGLIISRRTSEKGWKQFSFIDLVWLNIIHNLRNFGYSIEKTNSIGKDIAPGVMNALKEMIR